MRFDYDVRTIYTVTCGECGHKGSFEAKSARLLRNQMLRYGWSFGQVLRCSECEAKRNVARYGKRITGILRKGGCSTNRVASLLFASPTLARYRAVENTLRYMSQDGQIVGTDDNGVTIWGLAE